MRFWSQDGPDESVLRALAERRRGDFPGRSRPRAPAGSSWVHLEPS